MISDDEAKARILLKLFKRGKWGGSHTSFENLKKGWNPRDLGKEGYRRIDNLGRELIKQGFLLSKPTSYGLEVSLNSRFSKEIIDIVRNFYPNET